MPTPAITFGRMLGFLRFGPRSWGGDDSRQHPLTPPRVKLPSPPTPKQSQQRAERQLLALCWGLEGLIVVLVSQQAKTFPVLLFKLASFPHRTLPLSSGDRCDIPNRGRRIHQRQRSAGAAKWPGSITDIVCVDGAPGAGQYIACTAASWGPDSTICTGSMASPLEDLCHVPTCSTQHMATIPHGWSPPAAGNRRQPQEGGDGP
ncbi:uncharacterized protein LOC109279056 isoform X2 [Panthera pardus]|uniref:Uncharacterized protein LOC109279056 isoform X2 n=1 Tax=Panthera pardus TaxID=9691 RepID=A0A9W2V4Y8_PANPR|nr:uncharacterized protein LOC109279056 isoform X2 [Panthera pardus]